MKQSTDSVIRLTQAERRASARRAILEAAIELLAEGGYAHMTLADVGERAGYSRSLATHYYQSKPRLLAEIIDYVRTEFRRRPSDPGLTGLRSVEAEVVDVFDGVAAHPTWVRSYMVIAHEAATALPEVLPQIHRQNVDLRRRIEKALREAADLEEVSAELDFASVAFAVSAMLRGSLWEFFTDTDFDAEIGRQAVLRFVADLGRTRGRQLVY